MIWISTILIAGCSSNEKLNSSIDNKENSDIYNDETVIFELRDIDGNVLATGDDMDKDSISVQFDQNNSPLIHGSFLDAKKLETITTNILNEPLGIYIDNVLVSQPIVQSVITSGTFSIAGIANYEEAIDLVDKIKSSAK